jgi:hypothetical protein
LVFLPSACCFSDKICITKEPKPFEALSQQGGQHAPIFGVFPLQENLNKYRKIFDEGVSMLRFFVFILRKLISTKKYPQIFQLGGQHPPECQVFSLKHNPFFW